MATALVPDILDRPTRLLAGPGTGKTQALVDLYTELVEGGRAGREEILVLTFSVAAAGELERRIDARLRDSYGRAWIGTFHSFCARLLREHRPEPRRLLLSPFQEWLAMRRTLDAMPAHSLGGLARVAHTDGLVQDALAFVAMLKQNRVVPAQLGLLAEASAGDRLRALAAVYREYQATLERHRLGDFRDLVAEAIWLLEGRPELLESLRARFRYVLIDEFQDVDPAQFHLLATLCPPGVAGHPRLVVAGDPDQAIYAFRGSVPGLLSDDFPRLYGGRSLALDAGHRCPAPVIEAGRALLGATQPNRPAAVTSAAARAAAEVRVAREASAVDEALFVAREVRRLMLEDAGLRACDFAVLLRSTVALAGPFEDALRALGLPCEVRGGAGLRRNGLLRFLLNYLRSLAEPGDSEALERVLSSSLCGVDQRTASRLRRHAAEDGRPFAGVVRHLMRWMAEDDPGRRPLPWQPAGGPTRPAGEAGERPARPAFAEPMTDEELDRFHRALRVHHDLARRASHVPVAALAHLVLLETGVTRGLLEEVGGAHPALLADLNGALAAFSELEEVWERLSGRRPLLAEVAFQLEPMVARLADGTEPAPGSQDAVQVLTVHQAKGLEFEVVFLGGFGEGIFPLANRPHPLLEESDQRWLAANLPGFRPTWPVSPGDHLAEEGRLAYVGMTRARRVLYITCADEYDAPNPPSSFLEPVLGTAGARLHGHSRAPLEAATLLSVGEAEALLAGTPIDAVQAARLAGLGVDIGFVRDPEAGTPFDPCRSRPAAVAPDHFSATALNDYLKCPRLYWYNHHPGLARPPRGVELQRGSFLHSVLEEFHRREPEWRDLPPSDQRLWLDQVLEDRLEGHLERVEAVLDRRTEAQEVCRILSNYIRFATTPSPVRRLGTLAVERRFHLDLDGAEIHGQIDRINDTGEGTCEVVDYKTGRGQGAARAYQSYFGPGLSDLQLLIYYLACREGRDESGERIGLNPRFLSLWYPKDVPRGHMRQVLFAIGQPQPNLSDWIQRPLAEGDIARGRAVATEAIRRIREGDFRPAPRPGGLGTCLSWYGCPHSVVCPFGGQPSE